MNFINNIINHISLDYKSVGLIASLAILGLFVFGSVYAVTSSIIVSQPGFPNTVINAGSGTETAKYIVGIIGSTFYVKNGTDGQIIESSTSAGTTLQYALTQVSTTGGILSIGPGTYPYTQQLYLNVTNTINPIVRGQGQNTVFQFTGSGYAFTLNNTGTNKGHSVISDLKIDDSAITVGRHCFTTAGKGSDSGDFLFNIYFRHCDDALTVTNTNGFSVDHYSLMDSNRGIVTKTGPVSVPNALNFQNGDIQFITNGCVVLNQDGNPSTTNYIEHTVFENCGTALIINGSSENFVFKDAYIEGTTGTQDILINRGVHNLLFDSIRSNSAIHNMITLNSTGMPEAKFSDIRATAVTNSVFYIIKDSLYRMLILNPSMPSNSHLFNNNYGTPSTTNARVFGIVINGSETGTIVTGGTANLVPGDVVTFTGQLDAGSISINDTRGAPTSVMIGNNGTGTPLVVHSSGVGQVILKTGVAAGFGDTIVTSATGRRAIINDTETNPAKIIGYTIQTAVTGGLTYYTK